jgi:crotonobetainyl-CoA:carnitine CoA-transferase CaiB-like acyl-CoA transferase
MTQFLAGPFCGQTLSALGADVVVVESATRLVTRSFGPFGGEPTYDASMNFNFCGRGKRSITLNLKTAEGCELLDELIRSSDVLIENFSPRFAEQLGLGFERLQALNPGIVVGSLSAFGRRGPWGRYIGLHSGVMLMSGLAGVTRDEEGRPRFLGAAMPDSLSGTYLALAVVQALAQRERTGEGCQLELSMLEVGLFCMGGLVPDAATDDPALRHPARFLRTREPERFIAVDADLDGAAWEALEREVASLDRPAAMRLLQERGLRAGAVNDLADVFVEPHLTERGFVATDDHPVAGARPAPGVAWIYDGERPHLPHAPLLGADTDAVLRAAGLDAERIAVLRDVGALT